MSTEHRLKELALRLRMLLLLRKLTKKFAYDRALISDEPKWITVHPHGKGAVNSNGGDIKGTPVLLESETGEVLGGMGGKFTGKHISEACSKEPTINAQHDIKRGQMMRQNPQKFAAEQKAREKAAKKHLKDLENSAQKETAKEQAKQPTEQEGTESQATKISSLSSASTAKEINAALDSIDQIKVKKTLSTEDRAKEMMTKRDAIKSLYNTDSKHAAAAFRERVKAAGPPPAEFNSFIEARDYAHKLLPHANICFDNVDVKNMAPLMKGVHTVLNEFPALGKFITTIGDSKTLEKYKKCAQRESAAYYQRSDELRREIKTKYTEGPEGQEIKKTFDEFFNELKKGPYDAVMWNIRDHASRLLEKIGMVSERNISNLSSQLTRLSPDGNDGIKITDSFVSDLRNDILNHIINTEHEKLLRKEVEEGKLDKPYISGDRNSILNYGVVPYSKHGQYLGLCHGNMLLTNPINKTTGILSGIQINQSHHTDRVKNDLDLRYEELIGFHPKTNCAGIEVTMIHELGHAIDHALTLGEGYKTASDLPEIKDLYKKAKKNIRIKEGETAPYWKENTAELIAESFAAMLGGASEQAPQFMRDVFNIVKQKYQERFE